MSLTLGKHIKKQVQGHLSTVSGGAASADHRLWFWLHQCQPHQGGDRRPQVHHLSAAQQLHGDWFMEDDLTVQCQGDSRGLQKVRAKMKSVPRSQLIPDTSQWQYGGENTDCYKQAGQQIATSPIRLLESWICWTEPETTDYIHEFLLTKQIMLEFSMMNIVPEFRR